MTSCFHTYCVRVCVCFMCFVVSYIDIVGIINNGLNFFCTFFHLDSSINETYQMCTSSCTETFHFLICVIVNRSTVGVNMLVNTSLQMEKSSDSDTRLVMQGSQFDRDHPELPKSFRRDFQPRSLPK